MVAFQYNVFYFTCGPFRADRLHFGQCCNAHLTILPLKWIAPKNPNKCVMACKLSRIHQQVPTVYSYGSECMCLCMCNSSIHTRSMRDSNARNYLLRAAAAAARTCSAFKCQD